MKLIEDYATIHASSGPAVRSGVSYVPSRINLKDDARATPYLINYEGRVRRVWRVWRYSDELGHYEYCFIRNRQSKDIGQVIVTEIPKWVRYPADHEAKRAESWIANNSHMVQP